MEIPELFYKMLEAKRSMDQRLAARHDDAKKATAWFWLNVQIWGFPEEGEYSAYYGH